MHASESGEKSGLTLIDLEDCWVRFRTHGAVVAVTHRDAFFKRIIWRSGGREYFVKVGWTSCMTGGINVRRPSWPVSIVLGLFPGIALVRAVRSRLARAKPNQCSRCGYNLIGNVTGVCSECGKTVDEAVAGEGRLPPAF